MNKEEVEANFKKHLNREAYQNLLKNFELVKRVNLEIYAPDEKLEYLTGAKEFKDVDEDCDVKKDSAVLIVKEAIVKLPPETSAISSSSSRPAFFNLFLNFFIKRFTYTTSGSEYFKNSSGTQYRVLLFSRCSIALYNWKA